MNTHTMHLQRPLQKCLSSFVTAPETHFAPASIDRTRFTHKRKTELHVTSLWPCLNRTLASPPLLSYQLKGKENPNLQKRSVY